MDGVVSFPEGGSPSNSTRIDRSQTVMHRGHSKFHLNVRYLLPFFLYLSYLLDVLYICIFTDFKWSTLGTGKAVLMGRKLFPQQVSQKTGGLFIEINLMMVGLLWENLCHNMEQFNRKYRMVATVYEHNGRFKKMKQNGIVYSAAEGEAIFKFHCKGKKLAHLLAVCVAAFHLPFYNLNIALNWTGTLTDVKACLWINATIPYFSINLYAAILCFIFNCRYLRFRQRYQMNRLQSLISKGNRAIGHRHVKGRRFRGHLKLKSHWSEFSLINHQLNALSEQINGFSRFWSRYLSLYFTGLIFLVAYLAFFLLELDKSQNRLAVFVLTYFVGIIFCLLLWITLECSVLVVNNKETLKLQRIFTVHTSLAGRMPLSSTIKFDHIEADSKSIGRIGFKLLDSVQINSKMFELEPIYRQKVIQNTQMTHVFKFPECALSRTTYVSCERQILAVRHMDPHNAIINGVSLSAVESRTTRMGRHPIGVSALTRMLEALRAVRGSVAVGLPRAGVEPATAEEKEPGHNPLSYGSSP